MRILSVVGARPQFIKLAVICRAVAERRGLDHRIIHTGQHYDYSMSEAFFRDLGMPEPAYNLEVGSGSHGQQTAGMIRCLEPILKSESPDWVMLYGDTNSTVAGALVAAKLQLKLAHVEAGLRSFNRSMPEEINRVIADHVSDVLFCPTSSAVENLRREGLESRTVLCGDVMYDSVLANLELAEQQTESIAYDSQPGGYALATVHRAENTDAPGRLRAIMQALETIAAEICPIVLAIHPRTKQALETHGITTPGIRTIPRADSDEGNSAFRSDADNDRSTAS